MIVNSVPLCVLVHLLFGLQQTYTEDLMNTVAVVGTEVILKCPSYTGNCKGVGWQKFVDKGNPLSLYRENSGIINADGDRYSVDNSSGCNLHIKNAKLEDAGRFICEDLGPDRTTISKTGFLIILNSLPRCAVNVSDDSAVEGDGVQLTCELTFNGTDNASMTWKQLENVPPSKLDGKTVKQSHSVVAYRPQIPSYECITSFVLPSGIRDVASNIPMAPSCNTVVNKLLYPVKTVSLSPSLSVYSPGTTITCTSDGNPPPSFKWQITDSITDGKNENWRDIQKDPNENQGEFNINNATTSFYRCVATNNIRNLNVAATSHPFQVNYTGDAVGIAAGVTAGVVALLIIVVIICVWIRVCNKKQRGKLEKDEINDDHLPLKQTPSSYNQRANDIPSVPVATVRPHPKADSIKRPAVPPPEPMPRKELPKKRSPDPQQEEVLYAAMESEQAPRRFIPQQNEASNSEYAAITLA